MRCIARQPPSEANACPIDPNPPRAVAEDPKADEVDVPDFELPDPEPKYHEPCEADEPREERQSCAVSPATVLDGVLQRSGIIAPAAPPTPTAASRTSETWVERFMFGQ
jgi:hypothetical protein